MINLDESKEPDTLAQNTEEDDFMTEVAAEVNKFEKEFDLAKAHLSQMKPFIENWH